MKMEHDSSYLVPDDCWVWYVCAINSPHTFWGVGWGLTTDVNWSISPQGSSGYLWKQHFYYIKNKSQSHFLNFYSIYIRNDRRFSITLLGWVIFKAWLLKFLVCLVFIVVLLECGLTDILIELFWSLYFPSVLSGMMWSVSATFEKVLALTLVWSWWVAGIICVWYLASVIVFPSSSSTHFQVPSQYRLSVVISPVSLLIHLKILKCEYVMVSTKYLAMTLWSCETVQKWLVHSRNCNCCLIKKLKTI